MEGTMEGTMGAEVWVPCQCAPGEDRAVVRAALSRWIDFGFDLLPPHFSAQSGP